MGLTRGAWWPLNLVGQQVDSFVDGINPKLGEYYQVVTAELEAAERAGRMTDAQLKAAKARLDALPGEIDSRITDLKKLAPDNQRVALITATATESVRSLAQQYGTVAPRLIQAASVANQAVSAASEFAATFKDNPGRRLISLFLGSWLGLAVAGVLGLDLFLAAGVTSGGSPYWGVACTGLVMGLGSNPTHEVIRLVQEYKKTQKGENRREP